MSADPTLSTAPDWAGRRKRRRRRGVLAIAVLTTMLTGLQPWDLTEGTDATWMDSEYSHAVVSAESIPSIRNLRCNSGSGLLGNRYIHWDSPSPASSITGYRVQIFRGNELVHSDQLPITELQYDQWPSRLIQLNSSYTVHVQAQGPGDWLSPPWVATIRVTRILGILVVSGCDVESQPRNDAADARRHHSR